MIYYPENDQKNWFSHFVNLQYSAQDFYAKLKRMFNEFNFPGVKARIVSYNEGGILSAKRDYFCVSLREDRIDICAAPFGKNFFVSWWLTEKAKFAPSILASIPKIGYLFARQAAMTSFYHADTKNMFRESVHQIVAMAVDEMIQEKGWRLPGSETALPKVANNWEQPLLNGNG